MNLVRFQNNDWLIFSILIWRTTKCIRKLISMWYWRSKLELNCVKVFRKEKTKPMLALNNVICMYQSTLWSKLFWQMMVIHNVYCSQFNKRDKDHNINFNLMLSSSDCSLTSNYAPWAHDSNTFYGYFSKECTCTKLSYFLKG